MTELNLEIHGEGDPVLFIHGLGGTPNVFWPQVTALQDSYACRLLELPGSGNSPFTEDMSLSAIAARIADGLNEARAVHVVGHSLGTILCQHLALLRPRAVRSLFLIGPIHAPPAGARTALRDRAATARAQGMRPIADAIIRAGLSTATKAGKVEAVGFVRELLMRQPVEGYARLCEALAAVEAAPVESIGCPSALLTGDEDVTSPPEAARALAKKLPHGEVTVLQGCGHWATLERPAEVTAALRAFLDLHNS